nr:hypothetical protein [Candidatus Sigynarchaeota archaeon]
MELNKFEKIKEICKSKFETIITPQKDDLVIVIREDVVDFETSKKNYELGIGKVMAFPNKISINGRTYRSEELEEMKEGSVIMAPKDVLKRDDRHSIMIVKVPKQFIRAVDEAAWDGKFKTLDDVLHVLEEFK